MGRMELTFSMLSFIDFNQFIKREIPLLLDGKKYYDIVTPYGYGGPYIEKCVDKGALLESMERRTGYVIFMLYKMRNLPQSKKMDGGTKHFL